MTNQPNNKFPSVQSIQDFLNPVLQAYAQSGFVLTFSHVDFLSGTLYLNIDKKRCKG